MDEYRYPKPSAAQVTTFSEMIAGWPSTELLAWMDDDGTMGVSMLDDGLTTHAYFGRDGVIIGDWF